MYIIKGILNIIAGIFICFVTGPFNNKVLNICISLLFFVNGILDIRKAIKPVKAPKRCFYTFIKL